MLSPHLENAEVRGLFGYLDHDISFDSELPFVILYGANGVGKTTVLQMIDAVFNDRFEDLLDTPFAWFKLTFSNGAVLLVMADVETVGETPDTLHVSLTRSPGIAPARWIVKKRAVMTDQLREWLLDDTSWRPIERNLWQDKSDGETLAENELLNLFGQVPSATQESLPQPRQLKLFVKTIRSLYIGTDRLTITQTTRSERHRTTQRVHQHSMTIRRDVQTAMAREGDLSQELDRTFPMRLLSDQAPTPPTEASIRASYDRQNQHRARLKRIGLISDSQEIQLPPGKIEAWKLKAMSLFLEDAEKRLSTYETILPKLSLFHEMINERFVGKRIKTTAEGLHVEIKRTGRRLDPSLLSSGEQHELIMTFELIFGSSPGRLVLIDEPELSLHSVWQQHFLDDLQRILAIDGSRAIIATHSPQIVDRWSRAMVPLRTGVGRA